MSFQKIKDRESGLRQQLTAPQLSMIAIGGAIGTGLFLGSKFAIAFAGPSVILSYAIGGLIALLLMGCLAEMAVTHNTPGSFGAFAEHYIGPLAGFLVRYSYWSCVVLAIGTEVTAVAEYMQYWFKDMPAWIWMVLFSTALILVNGASVRAFGAVEYFFSSVKIFALLGFILLGAALIWGSGNSDFGPQNLRAGGGFFPHGLWGMWIAVVISIFSYLSIEMVAVAAGEAEHPELAVKRAFRATIARLLLFYLGSLAVILMIVPWNQLSTVGSPFVTMMEVVRVPFAGDILNAVVIVAALSAMNSQLYITSRMMFSLARAGDAPAFLGRLNRSGVPLQALSLSCLGVALATLLFIFFPERAFGLMMALSIFGALFTWAMIFLTHLFFRRHQRRSGAPAPAFRLWFYPATTLSGLGLMMAIMITTWFTEIFHLTLVAGLPFIAFLAICYRLFRMKADRRHSPSSPAARPIFESRNPQP
jgi:L-asparagine transporter-like permease